jgi:hypothetical protein
MFMGSPPFLEKIVHHDFDRYDQNTLNLFTGPFYYKTNSIESQGGIRADNKSVFLRQTIRMKTGKRDTLFPLFMIDFNFLH